MSDISLFKSCLRQVAIYLRDGIYKSCQENPFSTMPSSIVNDLMSATIDLQRWTKLRVGDLELLLTSGRLQQLKIHEKDIYEDDACQLVSQVLRTLKSHCQKLEILHLTALTDYMEWESEMSEAIENVLLNSPDLKDLVSRSSFDLKALRNCKKLRSLKLRFWPQQPWYDFLEKDNDPFKVLKYLEYFTVCYDRDNRFQRIPYDNVVVILRHCPELTSLGDIESSVILSMLHELHIPPSELKLQQYYWKDKNGAVKDAIQYNPMIEELDLQVSFLETISCLRNLRNLVYLNITTEYNQITGEVLRYALQEIGSRLKHLSFEANDPLDISLLLQCCPNLESLRIVPENEPILASSSIHLPHLQRLCFTYGDDEDIKLEQIFPQFYGCNQLTDLFLEHTPGLDDKTINCFLKKNSLLNLKVAYIHCCSLTELGFKEFLLNAPQLERVDIVDKDLRDSLFREVATTLNHKAMWNKLSMGDEFFQKRAPCNSTCCGV